MHFQLKQIALAGLVACLSASALATNYFFVTPKSGEMPKVAPFNVTLGAYTLPGAVVGVAYNGTGYSLAPLASISGDTALNQSLVTFALTSGNLPAGLVLNSAGLISGTPTAVGGGVIQVTASYKNASGAQAYAVVSVNLVVALAATTLPSGTVGLPYNNGLGFDFATVVSAPADTAFSPSMATFTLTAGSLPAGLTLSTSGKLTGTPTASSNTPITVTATYKSVTGSRSYSATTVSMGVTLASATLPAATVGVAYNTNGYNFAPKLAVTGDPSYNASLATFALTSGNMPAGMALSADGQLTGTPTSASASTTLQVAATYKLNTGSQSYNWVAASAGYLASCAQILAANPSTASGVQTIDPDGAGAMAPLSVNCDMTSNGGGWTLVAGIGATTAHISPASVAWTGTQGSGTELGKLSDAVINLIKGSTGSTTIAYRLSAAGTTSFFPGSCVFRANGNATGDCSKFTNTYAATPTWTSGGTTNDGCATLTYYTGLSSYIHAACAGSAVPANSGNLIYARGYGNTVSGGMVQGPSYAMGVSGKLWVR